MEKIIADKSNTDKEIKSLTGIRGIAALWVVFLHYRHHVIEDNNESYIIKLVSNGFIAVDIFFLLSAFVMCLAYSEEFKKAIGAYSYMSFIKKRFARIYPAYFFWVFMVLGFEFINLNFDYTKIVLNLLFIQNLFNNAVIATVFWSLSSEWILYMLFPFLYYILQKNKSSYVRLFFMIVCMIGVYALPSINNYIFDLNKGAFILLPNDDIAIISGINSIVRCFFCYVIGINLFLLIKDFNVLNYIWINVLKYCAIIGILTISFWGKNVETYVFILICSVILIFTLYINRAQKDVFFASKPIFFLGQISYSIYLCHIYIMVLISILAKKFFSIGFDMTQQIFVLLGSLILIIPISYLSYILIETKVGRWLKSKLFAQ